MPDQMPSDTDIQQEQPRKRIPLPGFTNTIRVVITIFLVWLVWSNWHENIPPSRLIERYAWPDSKFVHIDGMDVHCRITGQGKPIILLHDEHNSLHTWAGWTDSLSRKYQVISVDLPGYGLTGPHPRGSYSAFMYTSFLDSLTDCLHLKKFHLMGNGFGAQIAWQYAAEARTREKVDKLVLLDAPGFEEASNSWITLLAKTPVVNRLFRRITPKYFFKLMLEDVYADNSAVTDDLVRRHFELFLLNGNRKAYTDKASVRENRPPVEIISEIKAETLLMWGAEDTWISPENAYNFHQKIKGSILRIYRNTGHWPQEENPAFTAHEVMEFLENRL
ncbi:MAG: alpha/beta hydrolase [Saprospiraceae bacterium]|nr:alpha/beta hydrolase [Saprospiraceae bacterium]